MDQYELAIIENSIDAYNSYIALKAQEHGLALADINAYFKQVASGVLWNGVDYDLEFVSGGFISLDGYHPTSKGYALIANQFIDGKPKGINFGISLSTWDYIFKTAAIPKDDAHIKLGFPEMEKFPRGFLSQLFYGFRKGD